MKKKLHVSADHHMESCPLKRVVSKCKLFCQSNSIIHRWKLVKRLDCFGENRGTTDTRKIKLCGLKINVLRVSQPIFQCYA